MSHGGSSVSVSDVVDSPDVVVRRLRRLKPAPWPRPRPVRTRSRSRPRPPPTVRDPPREPMRSACPCVLHTAAPAFPRTAPGCRAGRTARRRRSRTSVAPPLRVRVRGSKKTACGVRRSTAVRRPFPRWPRPHSTGRAPRSPDRLRDRPRRLVVGECRGPSASGPPERSIPRGPARPRRRAPAAG